MSNPEKKHLYSDIENVCVGKISNDTDKTKEFANNLIKNLRMKLMMDSPKTKIDLIEKKGGYRFILIP